MGTTTFGYDGFGRLVSEQSLSGARLLTYRYDIAGNRLRVTHPDGVYFTFNYDGLNRLMGVYENGVVWVGLVGYDAQGRRLLTVRGGTASSYAYDGVSRLSSMYDELAGTAHDIWTGFAYNPASQVVTRSRSNDGYRFAGYASVDRGYTVNGLNQYAAVAGTSYCHDANGNLTYDGTHTYRYDAENRLTERRAQVDGTCPSVNYSGALSATLGYDALGRLYETSGSSGTTRFVWSGDELALEMDASGNILRRYVHGTGEDDPLLWYEGSGLGTRSSLQSDHQGSIVSVADGWGAAIAINSYDEYGIPGSGNLGRFQYTGQAWIPELGMYHYKARIYSPTLGRFMQVDPIGYDDQINLYAYVGNDPINNTDPDGECIFPCAIIGAVIDGGIEAATQIATEGKVSNWGAVGRKAVEGAVVGAVTGGVGNIARAAKALGTATRVTQRAISEGGRFASKSQKAAVFERAGGKCEYCRKPLTREPGKPNSAQADHVKAYSKGGKTQNQNLAGSCRSCNLSKGSKDISDRAGPDNFVPSNPNPRIRDVMKRED